jgi:uncharacterized protein
MQVYPTFRKIAILPVLIFLTLVAVQPTNTIKKKTPKFHVIAFYTGRSDAAHISYVHESNRWFSKISEKYNFQYDSTSNWNNMNDKFLEKYSVVIFLDTRPDSLLQRKAFEKYMKNGGGFLGFHFAAFALTPSAYPQNWNWYHDEFLGSGEYKSNTWRPTSAVLRVEKKDHPATKNIPKTFTSSPNEWYAWQNDLRKNPNIEILISIDSTSFPLGTGPKRWEIWNEGYYPVVWTNKNYKMLYVNMGHNDMDYGGTNKELSFTFANKTQNQLIINGLIWLGKKGK